MKKEIAIIIGSLDLGGAEKHLANVLPKLVASGWVIRVITLFHKGVLAPLLEKGGVEILPILTEKHHKILNKFPQIVKRLIRLVWCVTKLIIVLKKNKRTILHFFLPEAYIVGMFSASLARTNGPKIMSRRSLNYYQKRSPAVAWIEKNLHNKTTIVTGNSQAVIFQLLDENIPKNRLRLIYNGINLDPLIKPREDLRLNLKISTSALVMIIIANLIPYKAHNDLLLALSNIKENLPKEWHLLCVGRDDGIGNSLKTTAKSLQISNNVLWLGSRSDVVDLLSLSDIGILCSHEEGFSNAVLEGMARGLPMIVTDVGGNKEAVLHEETGLVVEPKSPEALGQAILKLASNPELAKQFGLAGQQRVKEHFSLDACVDAYVKLYEDCLAKDSQLSENLEKSKDSICAD